MKRHDLLRCVFLLFFIALSSGTVRAEPKAVTEARDQYETRVVQAKKLYEGVLERETESQRKRGNLSTFLDYEKELKHTRSEPGADFSDYESGNRSMVNAKARYKKEVESAQSVYQKRLEALVREYVQSGAVNDAKYVQDILDNLDPQVPSIVSQKRDKGDVFPVIRLSVEIAANGHGLCVLESGQSDDAPDKTFQGRPFTLSAFPQTPAWQGKQGIGRVVWGFHDPIETWLSTGWASYNNTVVDTKRKVLVQGLTELPGDSQLHIRKISAFPVRISCDFKDDSRGGIALTFWGDAASGRRALRFHLWKNLPDETWRIGCEIRKGNGPNKVDLLETLFFENTLSLQSPFMRSFDLSAEVAGMKITEVNVNRIGVNGQASRLDIVAPFTASSGISVHKKDNRFVVDDVYKSGPAGRAGLLVGDIVERVNGKELSDAEIRTFLDTGAFGDPVVLSVLRNGKSVELKFHFE